MDGEKMESSFTTTCVQNILQTNNENYDEQLTCSVPSCWLDDCNWGGYQISIFGTMLVQALGTTPPLIKGTGGSVPCGKMATA